MFFFFFFFSSRRRHTRYWRDWSSDVCSSDLQINPEIFLRRIVHDLVNEIGAQQWLAARGSKHPAGCRVQPVDCAPRRILGHSLDAIVIRPAVMAIEIAFPFGEEVGDYRLEVPWKRAGLEVRKHPAFHGLQDLGS